MNAKKKNTSPSYSSCVLTYCFYSLTCFILIAVHDWSLRVCQHSLKYMAKNVMLFKFFLYWCFHLFIPQNILTNI